MLFQIARETPAPWKSHPELGTGIERFGYNGFKRKFLFFDFDNPSMPNTGPQRVFRCAAKKGFSSAQVSGNRDSSKD
jgi:hypothetical protein